MSLSLLSRLMALGAPPRWHGNGFAQLDLNARQRLHVWHPDWHASPQHNSTIHDHVFDLTSEVLLGKVGHEAFDVVLVSGKVVARDDPTPWAVYRLDGWESGGRAFRDDPARSLVGHAHRYSVGSYLIAAGGSYSFPRYRFHETSSEGLTASLMTKSNGVDPAARPRILCPWGEDPTDAREPRLGGPTEEVMWSMVEEAVDRMWKSSQARIEACVS